MRTLISILLLCLWAGLLAPKVGLAAPGQEEEAAASASADRRGDADDVEDADDEAGEEAAAGEEDSEEDAEDSDWQPPKDVIAGLKFRSIGPALMSGRIGDFAVNPHNPKEFYVAVCSGGVWKTTNAGVTYKPIFDGEGSFSIGCVTVDPNNPHTVWVGTGENNSQRSVSWGDGVYRSLDGGKSWQNMGLKESEHIGMIAIDPRDSNTVFVAAQGPLWRSGGDRGLYRTTNGGKSWERVLFVSDDTGVNEVHLDPRDPDVVYVSSYQRRRHVWTLVNGGPESTVYKSEDGGNTWRKIARGLPGGDLGRIGLDISPANPDVIYAIVEAADGKSGFYRSTDRGETWSKRSGYATTSGQYYNEIICDPAEVDRVYALDTIMHVTEDGGSSFQRAPRINRHVDDHALWIDPTDNDHLLVGSDGGIYETYDRGANWRFTADLPITQFYRVSVDQATPFYNIYGGTQDNNSYVGPSRTTDHIGIGNEHWEITVGGDGYETQVDPTDPNIIYCQWQHGGLVRFDRRSGERVDIKPREKPGEEPYRWNWDSPLILSPHDHHRLYFAANILFRTDDQGNSWRAISGDLTRQTNRDLLKVMGRVQPVDAVSRHGHTSFYGNIVALSESPLVEDLIYIGTDDGLIQITEDGGENWRKISLFPTVPDITYVSCVFASLHDPDTVYASFDNHKQGDFKPYILVSRDRGQNWEPMVGDLPEGNVVYALTQDHVEPGLLFAGTEYGVFCTVNEGKNWVKMKSGLPTISVRDVDIQRRENDLVLGTFGRGFYVLDDYSPLRLFSKDTLKKEAHLFPVKPALRYQQRSRLGGRGGKGSQGASYYSAPNPPFGAVFTYHIKESLKTRKERRHEAEGKAIKAGKDVDIPDLKALRAEREEPTPEMWLIIRDADGDVVRRIKASKSKGLHRTSWDLRYASHRPPSTSGFGSGAMCLPGTYTVTLAKRVDGEMEEIIEPLAFEVENLALATFAAEDREEVLEFQQKAGKLQGAVFAASSVANDANTRLQHIRQAILASAEADPEWLVEAEKIQEDLNELLIEMRGDPTRRRYEMPSPPSIMSRINGVVGNQFSVSSPPTQTQRDGYEYAADAFEKVLDKLTKVVEEDLAALERKLDEANAPWTPGRLPDWQRKQ
jgi:photosystem II stability/assembly factor-like uncharacterized protein